ncbi:MAG: DUF1002 domain-containing protein [Lachnospiraceae bacterium]|nr:DUF1002 domain-containing protein [Lachnospiraceae bacterium]
MKKLTAIITVLALTIGMTVTAAASQSITFDESGNGTVTVTNEKKGYLALGADLTADQKKTVLTLLGVSEAELGDYDIVTVTNTEEHAALDKYIDSAVIGKRSLSSVLVKPAEKGHGVVVTTHNINYCTTNMYRNALITAGVTDAEITVAAPSQISGTAALIGALKAYGNMSGVQVSEKALDTALNELVTTGEIKEAVGSDDQAEEFISYIKTVVATNDLNTKEEIEAAIRKGMVDLNVSLSDEEVAQTVDLMMKVKAMGIDYKVLAEQADDLYAKYKDDIKAGTFDINKVSLDDLNLTKVVGDAITTTVKNIGSSIAGFFTRLFN